MYTFAMVYMQIKSTNNKINSYFLQNILSNLHWVRFIKISDNSILIKILMNYLQLITIVNNLGVNFENIVNIFS